MPLHGPAAAETFDVDVLLSFDCGAGVGGGGDAGAGSGDAADTNGIKGFCSVSAAFVVLPGVSHLCVPCEQCAEQH